MVEVFKTDVTDNDEALIFIERIHHSFDGYKANFDLEDCDNILRIHSSTGIINCNALISFLRKFDCQAEVLPDVMPAMLYNNI